MGRILKGIKGSLLKKKTIRRIFKNNVKKPRKSLDKDFREGRIRIETNLNVRIVSGFLGTLFFIVFLLTFFAKRSIEGTISSQLNTELNRARRTSTYRIEEYYHELELELSIIAKDYEESGKLPNNRMLSYEYLGVTALYILDKNYENITLIGTDDMEFEMKKRLEGLSFHDPFQPEGFRIDDGKPNQYIYYKSYDGYKNEIYVVFKVSTKHLNEIVENRDFDIDIINDEYYVIVSTIESKINDIQLDEITKNVLGGETGIASKDDIRYSYGFIDLEETALFIMSSRSEGEYYQPLSKFQRRIVMIWIFSFFCGITALVLIRLSISSYSSKLIRISLERASDLRYPYLKKEYIDIFEDMNITREGMERSLEFISRLEVLKSRIENQNQNYIEDIKHEKEFIKKLKTNKEMRELLKDELDNHN